MLGAGGARVGRGEAAILSLGSGHSPGWRWLSVSWCGLLQRSSAVCSSSPPAWLWQLPSPPCAVSSMRVLQCHSSSHSSSVLLCTHSVSSSVSFQFLRCTHSCSPHKVPGTQPLFFSVLVEAALCGPGRHGEFPNTWRWLWFLDVCKLVRFFHSPLWHRAVEGGLVLCFGERGFGVFPEGAVNHLCGIAVSL